MKKKSLLLGAVLALSSILAACSGDEKANSASDDDWKPSKPIEFIIPAGAGGGWDTTARATAKVLEEQKIVNQRFAAVNKPGGGGAIGWSLIDGRKTDNHLLFPTSPSIMFVHLNGQSDLGHMDFTPIAGLTADYAAYIVKSDSPFQDMNELVDAMKKDPASISVVGDSAPGSMDHMQFIKSVSAAGVDAKSVKYVSAQDGAGMTMLLGGQVDVYSTGVGEAVEQVRAGNVRVLGVTSAERLEGDVISEFPTLIEQGIDDTFVVWRGIMGPKEMSPAAAKYYENALKEMVETDAWKEELDRYGWLPNWMGSEEFGKFLDEEYDTIEKLMEEVGLKK